MGKRSGFRPPKKPKAKKAKPSPVTSPLPKKDDTSTPGSHTLEIPPRDDGSSDSVTPVELGPASNEIRDTGYSDAQVEANLESRYGSRATPSSSPSDRSHSRTMVRFLASHRRLLTVLSAIGFYFLEPAPLALLIGFVLAGGGVALGVAFAPEKFAEGLYTLAEVLFAISIALFLLGVVRHFQTHGERRLIFKVLILMGILAILGVVGVFEWHRPGAPAVRNVFPVSSDSLEIDRAALRADALRPIRDVAFRVNLKRQYSIQELGHFRIIYELFTNHNLDFFLGCQDAYSVNTSVDLNTKQFGIRCTVRHRVGPKNNFGAIPVYTNAPYYTTLIDRKQSVDTLEWSVDLYNQIPSYKTLEDLNRKDLYIFVTESLTEKISEVSFRVNNWELVSAKAPILTFPDDKPIAKWFMPLSNAEKSVEWRGVYLRDVLGITRTLGPEERYFVWSLDFGIIHPKKLPEPTNMVEPFR